MDSDEFHQVNDTISSRQGPERSTHHAIPPASKAQVEAVAESSEGQRSWVHTACPWRFALKCSRNVTLDLKSGPNGDWLVLPLWRVGRPRRAQNWLQMIFQFMVWRVDFAYICKKPRGATMTFLVERC